MNRKLNHIVFVDDDDATNFFHRIIVEKSGVCKEHLFLNKAKDALVLFQGRDRIAPELLLLDINMPYMDGWEFLEAFQALDLPNYPTVVMLTTSASPSDLQKAEAAPLVSKILHKSLKIEDLQAMRDEILGTPQS